MNGSQSMMWTAVATLPLSTFSTHTFSVLGGYRLQWKPLRKKWMGLIEKERKSLCFCQIWCKHRLGCAMHYISQYNNIAVKGRKQLPPTCPRWVRVGCRPSPGQRHNALVCRKGPGRIPVPRRWSGFKQDTMGLKKISRVLPNLVLMDRVWYRGVPGEGVSLTVRFFPPLTGLDLQSTLVEVSAIFEQCCGWRLPVHF